MRWPYVSAAACSAALLLAGCGGGAERRTAPPPRLPRPLAQQLAGQADAVAASLDRGDACAARDRAAALQRSAIAAVLRIPGRLRENLVGAVNELVSELPACRQPPPAPAQDHGKHKGHEKHTGEGG
jgi:hypothetical protein